MQPTRQLVHYKQIVLDKIIEETNNPTDRKIRQWTDTHIQGGRLLSNMEREGLIKIEFIKEGKTVRRVLTPLVTKIESF